MNNQYTLEQLEELSPTELGRLLIEEIHKGYPNKDYIKNLINSGADLEVKANNKWQKTSLHGSASHGHIELTKLLITAGAPLEALDSGNWTPLHWAARHGRIEVVQSLLEAGAPKDARTTRRETPWDWATPRVKEACPQLNPNNE